MGHNIEGIGPDPHRAPGSGLYAWSPLTRIPGIPEPGAPASISGGAAVAAVWHQKPDAAAGFQIHWVAAEDFEIRCYRVYGIESMVHNIRYMV